MEFEQTSSHRFRSSQDMNFSHSYYYFVQQATHKPSDVEFISQFDVNGDDAFDAQELEIVRIELEKALISETLKENLIRCFSTPQTSVSCEKNSLLIGDVKHEVTTYKHEVVTDHKNIKYLPLVGSPDQVSASLEGLIVELSRYKFLCLNDGIDHENSDSKQSEQIYLDALDQMFPERSPFELQSETEASFENGFSDKHSNFEIIIEPAWPLVLILLRAIILSLIFMVLLVFCTFGAIIMFKLSKHIKKTLLKICLYFLQYLVQTNSVEMV